MNGERRDGGDKRKDDCGKREMSFNLSFLVDDKDAENRFPPRYSFEYSLFKVLWVYR